MCYLVSQIYNYGFSGERTLLLGQTTDYGGAGVTSSLSGEPKKKLSFVSSVVLSTSNCTSNLSH